MSQVARPRFIVLHETHAAVAWPALLVVVPHDVLIVRPDAPSGSAGSAPVPPASNLNTMNTLSMYRVYMRIGCFVRCSVFKAQVSLGNCGDRDLGRASETEDEVDDQAMVLKYEGRELEAADEAT